MPGHSPYLPKGRRPGRQRRRQRSLRRRLRRAFVILLGVAVAWAAVLGFLEEWGPSLGMRWLTIDNSWLFKGSVVLGLLVAVSLVVLWEWGDAWTPHQRDRNLVVDSVELLRGDTVRARLKGEISDCRPGSLQVGLVCREFFDTLMDAYGRSGLKTAEVVHRAMDDDVAYEEWQPGQDEDRWYSFIVPIDVPYSYEGECLSFAWYIATRYRTPDDREIERITPLWVQP